MIHRVRTYLSGAGLGPVLIKAVSGSVALRIVGMLFGFLVGIQLARGLGAEGYGIYGVAMSAIALLTIPTEFGLPQLLTREVAVSQVQKDWARLHALLRWSTRSVLMLSMLVAAAIVAWLLTSGKGLSSDIGKTVLVGLLMVPLVALGNLKSAALRGMQHIVRGQLPDALVRPLSFSAMLFLATFAFAPLTPMSAMFAGTISACIGYVVAVRMLRKEIAHLSAYQPVRIDSRNLWASAIPMAMTEGMRTLQGNVAILVMAALTAEAAVGVFRVSLSVSGIVSLPITLFLVVGSPVISKLYAENDRERLQRLLGWLALGMTLGTFLLTLPFFLLGSLILGHVFGPEFATGNEPLLMLCLGGILFTALGPSVILLNMTGHERRVTRAFLVSLVVLLVSAGPLIHLYGGFGAAMANVFGMLVGAIMMWRDAIRLLALDCSVFSLMKIGHKL